MVSVAALPGGVLRNEGCGLKPEGGDTGDALLGFPPRLSIAQFLIGHNQEGDFGVRTPTDIPDRVVEGGRGSYDWLRIHSQAV